LEEFEDDDEIESKTLEDEIDSLNPTVEILETGAKGFIHFNKSIRSLYYKIFEKKGITRSNSKKNYERHSRRWWS
jgi:hypothetical protein